MIPDEKNPVSPLTINVSGQNARFNVASIDNSINTASSSDVTVFEQVRKAIAEQIPGGENTAPLAKLHELEKAVNTPSYAARYKEFMQTAADHVTVLAPFLAALASFLA